jgi:hypothetical protein
MIGVSRNKRTPAPNCWKGSLVWARNSNWSTASIKIEEARLPETVR